MQSFLNPDLNSKLHTSCSLERIFIHFCSTFFSLVLRKYQPGSLLLKQSTASQSAMLVLCTQKRQVKAACIVCSANIGNKLVFFLKLPQPNAKVKCQLADNGKVDIMPFATAYVVHQRTSLSYLRTSQTSPFSLTFVNLLNL